VLSANEVVLEDKRLLFDTQKDAVAIAKEANDRYLKPTILYTY
jgi:hypothetical protein